MPPTLVPVLLGGRGGGRASGRENIAGFARMGAHHQQYTDINVTTVSVTNSQWQHEVCPLLAEYELN